MDTVHRFRRKESITEIILHTNTLLTEGVENYSWEDAVRDLKLGALASVCFRVHFHKGFIGAKGRSLDRLIVIFNRLSTLILEIDAGLILP